MRRNKTNWMRKMLFYVEKYIWRTLEWLDDTPNTNLKFHLWLSLNWSWRPAFPLHSLLPPSDATPADTGYSPLNPFSPQCVRTVSCAFDRLWVCEKESSVCDTTHVIQTLLWSVLESLLWPAFAASTVFALFGEQMAWSLLKMAFIVSEEGFSWHQLFECDSILGSVNFFGRQTARYSFFSFCFCSVVLFNILFGTIFLVSSYIFMITSLYLIRPHRGWSVFSAMLSTIWSSGWLLRFVLEIIISSNYLVSFVSSHNSNLSLSR